jgi:hypothetical protein
VSSKLRRKDRLVFLLHAVAAQMRATQAHLAPAARARLWLVGENRAGIKSAARYLQQNFAQVSVLDQARHCGLFEASGPQPAEVFRLDDYVREWRVCHAGREICLCTLPGVRPAAWTAYRAAARRAGAAAPLARCRPPAAAVGRTGAAGGRSRCLRLTLLDASASQRIGRRRSHFA